MFTLYRKNRLGVGTWRIWQEGDNVIQIAHANVVGGQEVYHQEVVPGGLAGRSLQEQVDSRILSRINRQKDRGYVGSFQEAVSQPLTNTLGTVPPMLAKKIADLRSWPGEGIVQPKLDGFRCMVTRDDEGRVICYSRQGKILTALDHITKPLELYLPYGMTLDGEIYEHGQPLQGIASLAKRKQKGTENLTYHVYDMVSDDPFAERYDLAQDIVTKAGMSEGGSRIKMVHNVLVKSIEEVWNLFGEYREEGYEGAMLRLLGAPYESGTRSSSLLKVKARDDAEFRVLDVVPGADGLGILILRLDDRRTFRTLAPGDHAEKRRALEHKEEYIGRIVTVEYANLTNEGVPFHAVAVRWRG